MRSFLTSFLDQFDYPEEAKKAITECFDILAADEEAMAVINKHLDSYAAGSNDQYIPMHTAIIPVAMRLGTPWQTARLVMDILLSKHLKERYKAKGISEQIWFDTVSEFKYKLFETYDTYHIWGCHVTTWWKYFFEMKIIGIGRFQYEMTKFGYTYDDEEKNIHLTPDMKAVSVHIPGGLPLTKDLREESYRRAKEFFRDYYFDGSDKVLFMCISWLIYPEHEHMLPSKSNIVDFMHDFTVFDRIEPEKSHDLWRIFADAHNLPYDMLPRNNSLRKAYAERLCEGKKVGEGVGFFIR